MPGLVVLLPPADHELVLLDGYVELIPREAGNRQRDAQALRLVVIAGQPLDVVGRIAIGPLGDTIEHTLDFVEPKQERAG